MVIRLAQATTDYGIESSINLGNSLGEPTKMSVGFQILNVVAGLGVVVGLIGFFVFWVVALVSVIKRTDLKHDKIIWVLLLLLVGPLGMIIYFFMEDRKKYGIISLVLVALPLLMLPLYAIARFVAASM